MATQKLTTQDFRNNIFDYTKEQEWSFKGTRPAIIDFYADWCGPCRMVAPVLEELSTDFEGKVDTEVEQELAAVFGIQSIPSFLFIPMEGLPMLQPGALPKKAFEQVINERLLTAGAEETTN